MFKTPGGVKPCHAAVFGGAELNDEETFKAARAARNLYRQQSGAFGDDDGYSALATEVASTEWSTASSVNEDGVPERVMRGIIFLIKGLELADMDEAEALLAAARRELAKEFKRDMAIAAGGTLQLAKARSAAKLSASRAAWDEEEMNASKRPDGAFSATTQAVNFRAEMFDGDTRYRSAEQIREDSVVALFNQWRAFGITLIFLVQMYICIVVLIRAGFELPLTTFTMGLDKALITFPMLIKIVFSFFAPSDGGTGVLKFRPRDTSRRYVMSVEFALDVIGILPLDVLGNLVGSHCAIHVNSCGYVAPQWSLNHLLLCRGMLDNFAAAFEALLSKLEIHPSLARLTQSALLFLVSCHVVSCMVFFLLHSYPASFVDWFQSAELRTAPLAQQYATAYDWTTKNIVGMSRGSVFPSEEVQMVFNVCVSFFGVCVYGLLMANLNMYFERETPESTLLQTIDEVLDTAGYIGMPQNYSDDIISYYAHTSKARHHITEASEIVEDLPEELAEEIIFTVGSNICRSVPLLSDEVANHRFVLALMDSMVPVVLLPETIVFRRDDPGDSMYIIVAGVLNVLSPADDKSVVASLGPGSVVGEIALVAQVPRTATVVTAAEQFTDCLAIDHEAFAALLEAFPKSLASVEAKVAERVEGLSKLAVARVSAA
jgi:CRP/FNR family cyclic AMP-dependent transcriptional regulator